MRMSKMGRGTGWRRGQASILRVLWKMRMLWRNTKHHQLHQAMRRILDLMWNPTRRTLWHIQRRWPCLYLPGWGETTFQDMGWRNCVSYTPPAFLVESCSSPRSPVPVLHQSSLSPYVHVEVLLQSSSSPPLVRPQSVHSTWSPHGWSKEWTDCGRTGEGLMKD